MTEKKRVSTFDQLWDALCDGLNRDDADDSIPHIGMASSDGNVQVSRGEADELSGSSLENVKTADAERDALGTAPPPLCEAGRKYLADVRKFASWSGPKAGPQLQSTLAIFKEQFPGYEADADDAVAKGRKERKVMDTAYKLGAQGKPRSEFKSLRRSLPDDSSLGWKVKKQYDKGSAACKRRKKERDLKQNGKSLSQVKVKGESHHTASFAVAAVTKDRRNEDKGTIQCHPNDLRGLPPSDSWQLIIDETGDTFDENASQASAKKLGRFVGILVPESASGLEPLSSGWHAVDCTDTAEIDRVVQSVLDASVGVMGIDVRSLPSAPGERWMDGVGLLLDWVLRLMPVDGACDLKVKIEQRGAFSAGQSWDLVERDCLRRLALAYPHRASKIALSIETITKKGSSFNGYVDAVAFSWARTTASSKERIRQSGWAGTCLLESTGGVDMRAMLNTWDAFTQGVNLPEGVWWDLISSPQATSPTAVLWQFLDLVGSEARSSNVVWEKFLAEAKSRMSATPVDLYRLAAAVDWLQAYQPKESVILPALRLTWLTVQLARANHMGETEQQWMQELQRLGDQMIDEAAPLVCHADLHLAVAATNRYDFQTAQRLLQRWQGYPPAAPGLRYWGHVRSSLGQHAAFLGDNTRAAELLREALDIYGRLSDQDLRRRDELQTSCYLAIVLMDDDQVSSEEVLTAVARVTGDILKATDRLAVSSSPDDRYAHHLLLRWLVSRGDANARQIYVSHRDQWAEGFGHPWPLIQLYRGMLIRETDPDRALDLALDGANRAFEPEQGPTVQLIGACCRLVAVGWGKPWPEAERVLDNLEKQLPMASDRIDLLKISVTSEREPLDLLASVLPFNFH